MSGEFLSPILLRLLDPELKQLHQSEKTQFYSKVLPAMSISMFVYAAGVSVSYRMFEFGGGVLATDITVQAPNGRDNVILTHPWLFEIVNFSFLGLFVVIMFFHSYLTFAQAFVCPLLNLFLFYQICFIEYDKSFLSI